MAFPNGLIIYDLATVLPAASHTALSPFETFREPLIALCVGDGAEYEVISDDGSSDTNSNVALLRRNIDTVAEQLPRALLVQPVIFDTSPALAQLNAPERTIFVPRAQDAHQTSIKSVMCDISARFLAELSTLARSIQVASALPTPAGTTAVGAPPTAKDQRPTSLLRTTSLRADFSQTSSPTLGDDDAALDGLPPLSEVASAPADMTEPHDSRPQSPSTADTSPAPSLSDVRPLPQQRQVSRDSSVDSLSRRDMGEVSRQPSLKRRSMLRGGPSAAEVAELRLKARQTLIIGSLYLQAGRWSDALRELSDGTVQARNAEDHFWHAKGLENLLVTMLMLASSGMDFQIPPICQAGTFKVPQSRNTSGGPPQGVGTVRPSLDTAATLMRLASVLPELCRRILDVHVRGFSAHSEVLSRYAFSESIIRLARLLAYLRKTNGVLSLGILEDVVFGTKTVRGRTSTAAEKGLSKVEIADFVFRAFPAKTIPSPTASTDAVLILSGISAILGDLGLDRKQAIVNKELLAALIPAISQARTSDPLVTGIRLGPSENGAAISGTLLDVDGFMALTGRAYALAQHSELGSQDSSSSADPKREAQQILHEMFLNAQLQGYGSLKIKLDVLKLYCDVSESITNYGQLARYTTAILEVVGPKAAARSSKISGRVRLPREEQIRYMSKIVSTVDRSRSELGYSAEGRYWDSFLVRRIEVQPPFSARRLLARSTKDLNLARRRSSVVGRPGPFLHDPFLKVSSEEDSDVILVEGEEVDFVITMQNLYDFEVILEEVSLFCQGVNVQQKSISAVMPPNKLSKVKLTVMPIGAGKLDVLGCRVKVQGCSQEDFFLFEESWTLKSDVKSKRTGVPGVLDDQIDYSIQSPQTKSISYDVLPAQPMIHKMSTSLPQATVSMLDGERRTIKITVHNGSRTAVDFLHVSFQHNLVISDTSLLSDVEQYELDHQRIFQPILTLLDHHDADIRIEPGSTLSFDIELRTRVGLQNCSIVVDYAHLGVRASDVKQKSYTRQVTLPLTFAISPSVSIKSFDILPDRDSNSEAFQLVLDVHNAWKEPLTVGAQNIADYANERPPFTQHTDKQILQPASTLRITIPMPKLRVNDPSRPIPTLSGSSERQFVVSKPRRASVVEMNDREIFWYREELLGQVKATWVDKSGSRSGELDLRGIMLKPRMVDLLRRENIKLEISLSPLEGDHEQADNAQHVVKVDEMMNLKLHLTNMTQQPLKPYLEIEPKLVLHPADAIEVDVSQCLCWTGQTTQSLAALPPEADAELHFGLAALYAGKYTLEALLNDIDADGTVGRRLGSAVLTFVAA